MPNSDLKIAQNGKQSSSRAKTRCKICDANSIFVFTKTIRLRHEVAYFRCESCHFLQTEEPYWLPEVYDTEFDPLDPWQVWRPLSIGMLTENLILHNFNPQGQFLDYGGGKGIFVRVMRDRGFDFYRYDKYHRNLFAPCFDVSERRAPQKRFELATCFEVLEHLVNPLEELTELFSLSDNVFCSTDLQPVGPLDQLQSWHYLGDTGGGHISFFTRESLRFIARKFGSQCYSYGNFHLFTRNRMSRFSLQRVFVEHKIKRGLIFAIEEGYRRLILLKRPNLLPKSRLEADYAFAEQQMRERLAAAYEKGRLI